MLARRSVFGLVLLALWGPASPAAYPPDVEAARRACRDNNLPTDDAPDIQACKRAAAYFVASGGPAGYVRLYTWRACKLSTPEACKRFKEGLARIAATASSCKKRRAGTACMEVSALLEALARVPLPSDRKMLNRPSKPAPSAGSATAGTVDATPAPRPPALRVGGAFDEGRRALMACVLDSRPADCFALAAHHIVLGNDPALRRQAETHLCRVQGEASCRLALRQLARLDKRLQRCRHHNQLACSLAVATLEQRGLPQHTRFLVRRRCYRGKLGCVTDRAEAGWTPKQRADYRFHREACRTGYRPSCRAVDAMEERLRAIADAP